MDDDDFAGSRYARMRWNTPLSAEHADLLLSQLDLHPGRAGMRVADLGCGWGELLLRAVAWSLRLGTAGQPAAGQAVAGHIPANGNGAAGTAAGPVRGLGVDTDAPGLDRGRRRGRELGLGQQVEFVQADAAAWRGATDRVLCVGSSHAFGGTRPALETLAQVVPPGGRLLFGDGCWAAPPTAAALDIFGTQVLPLAQLREECQAAGWRVTHLSTAGQEEWDDFESSSRAGRQAWLLAHRGDPRAAEVRDWLDTREREYVEGYRGVLGFAYLVLTQD
jgi:SAM-dependent methyltransferase